MEDLFYELRIHTDESYYDDVSSILDLYPQNLSSGWSIRISFDEGRSFAKTANHFLDQLESKYSQLSYINVYPEDITIWIIYGFINQCNMEFDPATLERLGNHKIKLCISCYQN